MHYCPEKRTKAATCNMLRSAKRCAVHKCPRFPLKTQHLKLKTAAANYPSSNNSRPTYPIQGVSGGRYHWTVGLGE